VTGYLIAAVLGGTLGGAGVWLAAWLVSDRREAAHQQELEDEYWRGFAHGETQSGRATEPPAGGMVPGEIPGRAPVLPDETPPAGTGAGDGRTPPHAPAPAPPELPAPDDLTWAEQQVLSAIAWGTDTMAAISGWQAEFDLEEAA